MERLDFFQMGLGGANKSAAILAQLFVLSLFLSPACNRWLQRLLFVMAASSLVLLILTGSRGGLLAALLAALMGMLLVRPNLSVRIVCATAVSLALLLALATWSGFSDRVLGVFSDPSALARLDLWKAGVTMIAAAPHGWGAGTSGEVYMQWYQPLNKGYQFRTLLNDHLTWLAEYGLFFKAAYLGAWGAVLGLSWPSQGETLKRTTFLVWVTFVITSCFSRVAELWIVWIMPIALLLFLFASSVIKRCQLSLKHTFTGVLAAALLGCILYFSSWMMLRSSQLQVLRLKDGVLITPSATFRDAIGLEVDREVIGEIYGPSVRDLAFDRNAPVIVFDPDKQEDISERMPSVIILCRYEDESRFLAGVHYILLNPDKKPLNYSEESDVDIVVGQFAAVRNRPWLRDEERMNEGSVLVVEGMGNYLPDWNKPVASILRERDQYE